MAKLDIDNLKSEYIGKIFGWFTVTDIFRNNKNIVTFQCTCKCGTIKNYAKKLVCLNKIPLSCGCHHNTDEYKQAHKIDESVRKLLSEKRKQYYIDNPDAAKKTK